MGQQDTQGSKQKETKSTTFTCVESLLYKKQFTARLNHGFPLPLATIKNNSNSMKNPSFRDQRTNSGTRLYNMVTHIPFTTVFSLPVITTHIFVLRAERFDWCL